jgi:hypothetical protein
MTEYVNFKLCKNAPAVARFSLGTIAEMTSRAMTRRDLAERRILGRADLGLQLDDRPRYITATRSLMWRTTARSWAMKR